MEQHAGMPQIIHCFISDKCTDHLWLVLTPFHGIDLSFNSRNAILILRLQGGSSFLKQLHDSGSIVIQINPGYGEPVNVNLVADNLLNGGPSDITLFSIIDHIEFINIAWLYG